MFDQIAPCRQNRTFSFSNMKLNKCVVVPFSSFSFKSHCNAFNEFKFCSVWSRGHCEIKEPFAHNKWWGHYIFIVCYFFNSISMSLFFFGMVKDARDPLLSLHFANGQLNKIDHPSDSILDYIILVVRVCCSCVVCVCAPNWPSPSVVRMCLPIIVSFFPFCLPALLNSNMPIKSRICWEIVRKVSTLLLYWFIYLFLCCWFCCCWFSRQNKTNNARCFQVHSKNFVNWTNQHVSQQYGHCRRTATETSATEEHF